MDISESQIIHFVISFCIYLIIILGIYLYLFACSYQTTIILMSFYKALK